MKKLFLLIFFLGALISAQTVSELDNELDNLVDLSRGKLNIFSTDQAILLNDSLFKSLTAELKEPKLDFTVGGFPFVFQKDKKYEFYVSTLDKTDQIYEKDEIVEILIIKDDDNKFKFSNIVKLKLDNPTKYEKLKTLVFTMLRNRKLVNSF